ncbi:hypothetical protein BCR39DRAFT_525603 [Naematelia encephala]|uniref:Uncharacterized protein n=1 Tax=Naematelia encephala TaxID=71784 RepID=A0A1Y2BBA3_9TREE|nr:hypothetical protein BCR39DRAFT_525603 [Naematelia encephala]
MLKYYLLTPIIASLTTLALPLPITSSSAPSNIFSPIPDLTTFNHGKTILDSTTSSISKTIPDLTTSSIGKTNTPDSSSMTSLSQTPNEQHGYHTQQMFDLPPLIRPIPASIASAIDARFTDLPERTDEPIPILVVVVDDDDEESRNNHDNNTDTLVQDGRVQDGRIQDGLVQDGQIQDGRVQDSQTHDSLVQDGLVQDGTDQDSRIQDGTDQNGIDPIVPIVTATEDKRSRSSGRKRRPRAHP